MLKCTFKRENTKNYIYKGEKDIAIRTLWLVDVKELRDIVRSRNYDILTVRFGKILISRTFRLTYETLGCLAHVAYDDLPKQAVTMTFKYLKEHPAVVKEIIEPKTNKKSIEKIKERKEDYLSKFTLIAGDKKFELGLYQSPRGLRNKEKRPDKIIIDSKECLDYMGLIKYIDYLQFLLCSMELKTK